MMNGFFFVDKQKGDTSFDVVKDIRRATSTKKVGHSGTLDPLATGLLVVAVGEGTKFLEYMIACDKEYEVVARFGAVSDTFDADGRITEGDSSSDPVENDLIRTEILKIIKDDFLGNISQIPPKYSALKIAGRRACDIMRAGGEVEMKTRQVKIYNFEIMEFNWPFVKFRVNCGSGTYIRSLVHDLGQKLGCGAYVQELRRTKVGKFDLDDVSDEIICLEDVGSKVFDRVDLSDDEFEGLKNGCSMLSKKVEQGSISLAFYKAKVCGFLLGLPGGEMRFKKRVFQMT